MKTLKKLLSSIVAVSLLMTTAVGSFSSKAEENPKVKDIKPDWFSSDNVLNWWATDTSEGADGWRFSIVADENKWTYTINQTAYDYGHCKSTSQDAYTVNINETPYLNFESQSDANTDLSLWAYALNDDGIMEGSREIKITHIARGDNTLSVDLRNNSDIRQLAEKNKNGQIRITNVSFNTKTMAQWESVSISNLVFSQKAYETTKVIPKIFTNRGLGSWWMSDQYSEPETWRYKVSFENNVFSYTLKDRGGWDAGHVESNCNYAVIDMDETPILNFDYRCSKNSPMYLYFSGLNADGSWANQFYVEISGAGYQGKNIDLRTVKEIIANKGNTSKISLDKIWIGTKEFECWSDYFTIGNFCFTPDKTTSNNVLRQHWFDKGNYQSWFDMNCGRATTNGPDEPFLINDLDNNVCQYFYRWGGNGNGRVDVNGPAFYLNVNEFPELKYDITTTKGVELIAQLYELDGAYPDGDTRTYVKIADFEEGGEHKGTIDINSLDDVMDLVSGDGLLYFVGLSFKLKGFENGDYININNVYFSQKTFEMKTNTTVSPVIDKDTVLTFSVDTNVTDDVKYQWYDNGVAISNANTKDFNYTVTIGEHNVYCIATLDDGNDYYINSKNSDNLRFMSFIKGDINLDANVNALDLVSYKNYILKGNVIHGASLAAADANGDGIVDIKDIIRIKKSIA